MSNMEQHKEGSMQADIAFCKAMTTEGLERFNVIHDAIVEMYENDDHAGMERMMELALGTGNRGYVRTAMISIKPVKHAVSEEKWDRLVEFLRKGNKDTKGRWVPVEEALPDIEEGADPLGRPMSRKVLVKYRLSDGVHHDVDQMFYPSDRAPRWFDHWDTVVAWMEIPE